MTFGVAIKMADTQPKKARKCGNCGQEGHDKRKCPGVEKKVEVKPETKAEPQTVYGVLVREDNGDDVQDFMNLYASIDGLMEGLTKTIQNLNAEHADDDLEDEGNKAKTSTYFKDLHYYTDVETFKNIPVPTKEFVENLVNTRGYRYNKLLIKVGDDELGRSASYGCELSVFKKTVNS